MKKTIQFFKSSIKGIWLILRHGPNKVVEWKEQTIYDSLTNLLNLRYLEEWGKKELARAVRYGHSLAFIEIDIDDFKTINDKEGHLTGDKVLQSAAVLLEKICREGDLIFRVGGDEFLIILPETNKENAEKLVERIRERQLVSPGGRKIELSCGIKAGEKEVSLEALRKEIDAEMYRDKRYKKSKLKIKQLS